MREAKLILRPEFQSTLGTPGTAEGVPVWANHCAQGSQHPSGIAIAYDNWKNPGPEIPIAARFRFLKMDELLEEFRAAQARILILIAGYADFLRLNLIDASDVQIEAHLDDAVRRNSLLENAIKAILDLIADGYPELPKREVGADIFEDMIKNLSGMQIAIMEFEKQQLPIVPAQ